MGKGMSVAEGNGGKGVRAVNELGMFGLGSGRADVGFGGMASVGTGADI